MPHVILFVDDEPQVLDLLRMTFPESAGYEALTAESGEEALRILEARNVHLLVTDQRMPNMTGIELVARARAAHPNLCAIVLTAYTEPKDLVDAINRGEVYRYLTKPWETGDLRQTVMRALEKVDLEREKVRLHAELERRLAALRAAAEIAREVGLAGSFESLVDRLLARLPTLIPCDLAAALVAPRGSPAALVLQRFGEAADDALLRIKNEVITAWQEQGGKRVAEAELTVRVTSRPGAGGNRAMRARLIVPLQLAGEPAGLIMLQSAQEDAFGEGDARVLDLLANELVESLRALGAKMGEERRRLERVVDCMADGLLVAYVKSNDVVANPAARRMLRAPEGEQLSVRWLKETLGFYPFDLVRGLDTTGPGPALLQEELRVFDRSLSSVVSPVTDADGRLSGVAVALRDVTEQKQLEERKEEFVQVVSHELRTPLTAVTGALDLVLGGLAGELTPKQTRFLRMARESSEKLNAIVDDLLDLARLAKGKMRMDLDVTFLDEIAHASVEKYTAAASEKGQSLTLQRPDRAVKVTADSGRLGQVFSNLLTNAIKFTPDNGIIRASVFASRAVEGWAGVTLWNNGEPIAEADLERIFEKFEQARTDRTRRVRGTGLGLAICRSIIEAHGGRIWAECDPEEGVRFVAALPAQPIPGDIAPERVPAPVAGGSQAPLALVIDGIEDAAAVRAVLLRRGMRVVTAYDAASALALARRSRPRLICMDPNGVAGGRELYEQLRNDPELRRVPLMVLSAQGERQSAFTGGAASFLAKPAQADELGGAADSLLRAVHRTGHRVLVVDDDPSIRAICVEVLGNHGYAVSEADSCAAALVAVRDARPHLILVDVMLPDGDGFELLEKLKEERPTDPMAAVFLSARGQTADKVRGFRLGADDYLTKPFDAVELVARIDAVLRRRENAATAAPGTRLPGGRAVEQEVDRRLQAGVAFACCTLEMENLEAYADHYGYAKADGVVLQAGDLVRDAVRQHGGEGAFVGHLGGGDFVFLATLEQAEGVCREVVAAFDRIMPLYYDRQDHERGFIEAEDRSGIRRREQLVKIALACVECRSGRFNSYAEIARAAAELRRGLPAGKGSTYAGESFGENAAARSA
jgi:DNA-binding response OmpR family regulator/signal transduction histidine kinase